MLPGAPARPGRREVCCDVGGGWEMTPDGSLHAALGRVIGAEHVLAPPPPDSPYNSDMARRRGLSGRADAVALPGSAQEVADVVAWCYAHDVPIVPRGGGTGLL